MKITLKNVLSVLQLDFSFLLLNESQGTYLAHFFKILYFDGLLGCHLQYSSYPVLC